MNAVRNLEKKYCHRATKRKKPIDILVIRVNRDGELRNSKPCSKCLESLKTLRFFKVKWVYYSINGSIIREKFSTLFEKKDEYVTRGLKI